MLDTAADQGRTHVGPLLRQWRSARGRNQLDLALESQVSERHVSFIETGRSVPSKATLLTLADALDVPFRERNALLVAAGYVPTYAQGAWDASEMASVEAALGRMLRQQEPYPALVLDRHAADHPRAGIPHRVHVPR